MKKYTRFCTYDDSDIKPSLSRCRKIAHFSFSRLLVILKKKRKDVIRMFKKKDKVKLELTSYDVGLIINALLCFRNKAIQEDLPTEDINELILQLCD